MRKDSQVFLILLIGIAVINQCLNMNVSLFHRYYSCVKHISIMISAQCLWQMQNSEQLLCITVPHLLHELYWFILFSRNHQYLHWKYTLLSYRIVQMLGTVQSECQQTLPSYTGQGVMVSDICWDMHDLLHEVHLMVTIELLCRC